MEVLDESGRVIGQLIGNEDQGFEAHVCYRDGRCYPEDASIYHENGPVSRTLFCGEQEAIDWVKAESAKGDR